MYCLPHGSLTKILLQWKRTSTGSQTDLDSEENTDVKQIAQAGTSSSPTSILEDGQTDIAAQRSPQYAASAEGVTGGAFHQEPTDRPAADQHGNRQSKQEMSDDLREASPRDAAPGANGTRTGTGVANSSLHVRCDSFTQIVNITNKIDASQTNTTNAQNLGHMNIAPHSGESCRAELEGPSPSNVPVGQPPDEELRQQSCLQGHDPPQEQSPSESDVGNFNDLTNTNEMSRSGQLQLGGFQQPHQAEGGNVDSMEI